MRGGKNFTQAALERSTASPCILLHSDPGDGYFVLMDPSDVLWRIAANTPEARPSMPAEYQKGRPQGEPSARARAQPLSEPTVSRLCSIST